MRDSGKEIEKEAKEMKTGRIEVEAKREDLKELKAEDFLIGIKRKSKCSNVTSAVGWSTM